MQRVALLVVLVSVPLSCAPPPEGLELDAGGSDAGSKFDGGVDSGVSVDAGFDAGTTFDAGFDGGAKPDAGPDGGAKADAGLDAGFDAGATFDAGLDAGLKVDGGLDAGPLSCAVLWDAGTASSLSPSDHAALTMHLEILSGSWVQNSVNAANNILSNASNTEAKLLGFFTDYFITTGHPFTDALSEYLGYPTFSWFDAAVHRKLQRSLATVLWSRSVAVLTGAGHLGTVLGSDAGLRTTTFNAQRFFADLGKVGALTAPERAQVTESYRVLVDTCASATLKASTTFNLASDPYVPSLRAQVWMAYRDLSPTDAPSKATLAQTLGLSGTYLSVWYAHGTLLHDNNTFSTAQKNVIAGLFASFPPGLLDLSHLTQNEMLGNVSPRAVGFRNRSGVNIFGDQVGTVSENSFPPDVTATHIDIFSAALAHECNHIVDALYIEPSPARKARKDALIARAGWVNLQYLRSQVGGAFFQGAPQEFIASISNEWFTDTGRTLELAALRFAGGYFEPLNQFLFFAELYSMGGATTRFYRIDTAGVLTTTDVPVTRDSSSRIKAFSFGGKSYDVTFDAMGFATALTVL